MLFFFPVTLKKGAPLKTVPAELPAMKLASPHLPNPVGETWNPFLPAPYRRNLTFPTHLSTATQSSTSKSLELELHVTLKCHSKIYGIIISIIPWKLNGVYGYPRVVTTF